MKKSLILMVSLMAGCSSAGATGGPPQTAAGTGGAGESGMSSGGSGPNGGAAQGGSAQAGATQAGSAGQSSAGSGASGAGGAGGAGGASGAGGQTGGSGGMSVSTGCPAPPYAASPMTQGATVSRVVGVPPADAFNNNGNNFGVLEGPLWLGGVLYVSEIGSGTSPPPSRILKVTSDGQVSIFLPDAGTNGLAMDANGNLLGANHKTGAITRFGLTGGASTDIVSMYMGQRFNSPNDLAVRRDGNLYFTDPDYQAPSTRPQTATRAYRVAPGVATATPIVEGRPQPNGVTLSADGTTLYVSASDGVFSHPVAADGGVGSGTKLSQSVGGADGMGMDCAGNLYVTTNATVVVLSPTGTEVGRLAVPGIQGTTNVAFGGPERKTLYITSLGTGAQLGLHKVDLAIPGMPY